MRKPEQKRRERREFIEAAASYRGEDCLLWPYGMKNGAPHYREYVKGRTISARLCVARLAGLVPPDGLYAFVRECDDPRCLNPAHSRPIKAGHVAATLRQDFHKAQDNPNAKLSVVAVRKILAAVEAAPPRGKNATYRRLASEYGVSWQTIRNVATGETYAGA